MGNQSPFSIPIMCVYASAYVVSSTGALKRLHDENILVFTENGPLLLLVLGGYCSNN